MSRLRFDFDRSARDFGAEVLFGDFFDALSLKEKFDLRREQVVFSVRVGVRDLTEFVEKFRRVDFSNDELDRVGVAGDVRNDRFGAVDFRRG